MTTRDEYVSRLKSQLDRWNADLEKWERHAKGAQAEARKHYDKQLADLRAQREKALYQMKLLQGASATAWQQVAEGADAAWAAMSAALDRARANFEKR